MSISTVISMEDRVSGVLNNITSSINSTIGALGNLNGMQSIDIGVNANVSAPQVDFSKSASSMAVASAETSTLGQELGSATIQATSLEQRVMGIASSSRNTNMDKLQQGLAASVAKAASLEHEISKTEIALEGADADIRAMQKDLELMKASGKGSASAIKELESNIKMAEQDFSRTSKSINKMEADLGSAERSAENFASKIRDAKPEAEGVNQGINKWQSTIVAANQALQFTQSLFRGLMNMTGMVDDAILVRARLDNINDGLRTTDELQTMINQSANRARVSYADMATSVAKIQNSSPDAFASVEDSVAFVELLNKSFKATGSTATEVDSAMYNINQALNMGVVQGNDLKAILSNAPMIAKAMADELGVGVGQLKKMGADGEITADVLRNAVFNSAENINQKFAELPMTFADAATLIQNYGYQMFEPVFQRLTELVNSPDFLVLMDFIGGAILNIANAVMFGLDNIMTLITFLSGVFGGMDALLSFLMAGIAAYFALVITQGAISVATIIAETLARWSAAAATSGMTMAQWALNAAMAANPIGMILTLVAMLVAALIVLWNTNIGFKYAFLSIWDSILFGFDMALAGLRIAGYGILNFFDSMWAGIATMFQDGANGVINTVNGLIEMLNKIPGVSFDTFEQMTFGTEAALVAEANKQARNADAEANLTAITSLKSERDANRAKNQAAEEAAASSNKAQTGGVGDTGGGYTYQAPAYTNPNGSANPSGGKLDSVGKIEDDVSITEEDIKLMRDVAQIEFINQYTTLRPEMKVTIDTVNENADVSGILNTVAREFKQAIEESL